MTEGDQTKNNYMMWALMIPGEFRYPAEANDIRGVYEHFMAWVSSNGAEPMPAGSIERTTCYGKRLRTIRSLFRIRKMPADRGLRRYRGRPGRAGLPQARGPQALKLRGTRGFASQRSAGLGRTETPLRRPAAMSFPGVKKPRSSAAGLF